MSKVSHYFKVKLGKLIGLKKAQCPWCFGQGGRGEGRCVMCNATGKIYYIASGTL